MSPLLSLEKRGGPSYKEGLSYVNEEFSVVGKKDYYEILGVKRDAAPEEIRKAYHKVAMKYHPDRNPGNSEAEVRFKEAAEAYDILRDPEKRKRYDQMGHEGLQGFAGREFHSFEDIFEAFGDVFGGDSLFDGLFGGSSRRMRRGAHLQCEVKIDFRDALADTTRTIRIDRTAVCGECRGSGARAGTAPTPCKSCGGRGEILQVREFLSIRMPCPKCRGAGSTIAAPCAHCHGQGRVRREETIEVKIPAGVEDGTRLRLAGQGEAGANGSPPGDLFVIVRVKGDPFFERRDDDVFCQVPIPFSQAALGAQIDVPSLAGKTTRMKIPPGTQPSQMFRLRGMGFPSVHGYGRGDQLVEILVEVPKKLTAEQEKLLAEFAKTEERNIGPLRKGFLDRLRRYFE